MQEKFELTSIGMTDPMTDHPYVELVVECEKGTFAVKIDAVRVRISNVSEGNNNNDDVVMTFVQFADLILPG